jgi:hypothetical protein
VKIGCDWTGNFAKFTKIEVSLNLADEVSTQITANFQRLRGNSAVPCQWHMAWRNLINNKNPAKVEARRKESYGNRFDDSRSKPDQILYSAMGKKRKSAESFQARQDRPGEHALRKEDRGVCKWCRVLGPSSRRALGQTAGILSKTAPKIVEVLGLFF